MVVGLFVFGVVLAVVEILGIVAIAITICAEQIVEIKQKRKAFAKPEEKLYIVGKVRCVDGKILIGDYELIAGSIFELYINRQWVGTQLKGKRGAYYADGFIEFDFSGLLARVIAWEFYT